MIQRPRTVVIDCIHGDVPPPADGTVTVAVDVIRATTTAITAVAGGRRVLVAASIEAAVPLAARLSHPLLAGELGGRMPYGFDVQNSPVAVAPADQGERDRPVILLSTSGTRLMAQAAAQGEAYAACLRNATAQAAHLAGRRDPVRLLGADSRGEFREEDQLCCARIACELMAGGYVPGDAETEALIRRWGDAPDDALLVSRSVRYLRDTGQGEDLDFILSHVDDLQAVFAVVDGEIMLTSGDS